MNETQELWFDISRGKIGWRTSANKSWEENERFSIYNVEGLDRPIGVEIVTRDDVVDVCIDNRRTLICRLPRSNGDRFFFFVQNGRTEFNDIEMRMLTWD